MSCYCRDYDILFTVEGLTGDPDNLETTIKLCFYDQKHFQLEPNGNGGGGGGAGQATFNDVIVHKQFDQYSPVFAVSVANGQAFPSAVVYFIDRATGDVFYKVTLREIYFTYFEQLAVDFNDNGLLVEKIKINYEEIEWEWNGISRCWDISENAEC